MDIKDIKGKIGEKFFFFDDIGKSTKVPIYEVKQINSDDVFEELSNGTIWRFKNFESYECGFRIIPVAC